MSSRLRSYFRNLFRREHAERELDAEVRSYLDQLTEEKIAAGMSPAEARRAAHLELGGAEQVKEQVRDARSGAWLGSFWQDIRFGARQLRRNPGFTTVAVVTLALGIGANTAIFSIVNAVLLRPMNFPNPHELVLAVRAGTPKWDGIVSYADFVDWSGRASSFQAVGALATWGQIYDAPSGRELIRGGRVSTNLFRVLGVSPVLGRDFTAEDDAPGAGPVVIVSHAFWIHRLDGAPSAIGSTIVLNSKAYTVVGILPASFRSPFHVESSEMLWTPLDAASTGMTDRNVRWLTLVARLKSGVPFRQAASEVEAMSRAAYQDPVFARDPRRTGFTLIPLQEQVGRLVGGLLWLVLTVTGFVLLIACANLIGLQLSRNFARQPELAVRAALGASRARLIALLATETLLLALAGGAFALLIGVWVADAIRASLPMPVPRLEEISLDWRVILSTAAVSLACGLLSGVLPALRASQMDIEPMLKQSPSLRTARPARLRSVFAVVQVAAAAVLLAGAGLMARSLVKMINVDTGFTRSGIVKAEVQLLGDIPPPRRAQLFREMQERVYNAPGVHSAGFVDMIPLGDSKSTTGMQAENLAEGVRPDLMGQQLTFEQRTADEAYFRTMDIPLLRGRLFRPGDERPDSMGVIISENLARQLWGHSDPVGRRINPGARTRWATVVGVVGSVRQKSLTEEPSLTIYRPFAAIAPSTATMVVRTEGDPALLIPTLRALVLQVDRTALVRGVETMAELHTRAAAVPQFLTILVSSFALLGLLMALVGLFGIMSYLVVQQTREFGVRMALGAQRGDILRLVLRRGMLLVSAGLILGLIGAWVLTRFMKSLLYGVEPTDAFTYAGVAAALALVSLTACLIPALRAARIEPMAALRYE